MGLPGPGGTHRGIPVDGQVELQRLQDTLKEGQHRSHQQDDAVSRARGTQEFLVKAWTQDGGVMIPGAMGGYKKFLEKQRWKPRSHGGLVQMIFRFYVNFLGVFSGGGWRDGRNFAQRLMLLCKTGDFI